MAFKIAVVGRQLKNAKWLTLFDILEEGKKEEAWEFERFEIDQADKKAILAAGYDFYIYVATKPFSDVPNKIHFTVSADDNEIIEQMQELANAVFGSETEDEIDSDNGNDPAECSSDGDDSLVSEGTTGGHTKVSVLHDSLPDTVCPNSSPGYPVILKGIVIDVNGRDVHLTKDDAESLKDMMVVMKEYGYKIKDVVVDDSPF